MLAYFGLLKKEFFILNLRNGQKIKMRTNSTDFYAFVNVWIVQEYKKDGFDINNNDTVIDIGGHIGLFALYAAQSCKNGRILSFEPMLENFSILKENLSLNGQTNISAFNAAVTKKSGKVKIFQDKDQAAHTLYGKSDKYVEIDAVSLKEIIDSNNISKCDLLKMDCEGAEYEILATLSDDYFQKISRICMEYHPIEDHSKYLSELVTRLKKLGYTVVTVPYSDGLGLLFANK